MAKWRNGQMAKQLHEILIRVSNRQPYTRWSASGTWSMRTTIDAAREHSHLVTSQPPRLGLKGLFRVCQGLLGFIQTFLRASLGLTLSLTRLHVSPSEQSEPFRKERWTTLTPSILCIRSDMESHLRLQSGNSTQGDLGMPVMVRCIRLDFLFPRTESMP